MIPILRIDAARFGALMDDLRGARHDAKNAFDGWSMDQDPEYLDKENAAWHIEKAFLKLLVATETLGLEALKDLVNADIKTAGATSSGFAASKLGPEEPYSVWLSRYSQHLAAIETLGPSDEGQSVTKDLKEILRASIYPITDPALFPAVPTSENDVHRRIEGVLRCVFPDLKRQPVLTKRIKNFEPDTGLPSIGTLIEYKFLADRKQVSAIADQILADTRGYVDKEWRTFVYVVYETRPIKPEKEWNLLLRDSDVPESTSLIVLSGVPAAEEAKPKKRARHATAE